MTLAEVGYLLRVDPKWVLNALTALGLPKKYSPELARRLAVALVIHVATGAPLFRCVVLGDRALRRYRGGTAPVSASTEADDVALAIDIRRILSSFNARLSVIRTTLGPRQRGRPVARRRDPLQAASDWGIDLTLVADSLRKTAEQRLRQLDAMAAFAGRVRRRVSSAG